MQLQVCKQDLRLWDWYVWFQAWGRDIDKPVQDWYVLADIMHTVYNGIPPLVKHFQHVKETNFTSFCKAYYSHGYILPSVVTWNDSWSLPHPGLIWSKMMLNFSFAEMLPMPKKNNYDWRTVTMAARLCTYDWEMWPPTSPSLYHNHI